MLRLRSFGGSATAQPGPLSNDDALALLAALGDWQQMTQGGTYAKPSAVSDGIRALRSPALIQYDLNVGPLNKHYKKVRDALNQVLGCNGWAIVPEEPTPGNPRRVHIEITNPAKILELAPTLAPGVEIVEPRIPGTLFVEREQRRAAKAKEEPTTGATLT